MSDVVKLHALRARPVHTTPTSAAEQSIINRDFDELSKQESLLPIKVTAFFRKKIEEDPSNPKFLRTVRGEGYIFSLPDEGR